MKHNDDILIDRFLRGELTAEERKNFQHKLENDDRFSQRVQEMEEVSNVVRESILQEKLELLKGIEAEIMSEGEESNNTEEVIEEKGKYRRRLRIRRWSWLAAAAAVLIGVMMFWPEGEVKGPSEKYAYMFGDNFETDYIKHSVQRGEESTFNKKKRIAYDLYSARIFEKAIPLLHKQWDNNHDTLSLYYLGISYLGIGNDIKGEEILMKNELKKIKND